MPELIPTSFSVVTQYDSPVTSTITRPACDTQTTETMELNACRYLYVCPACGATLRPHPRECCVYCSYGDIRCPPQQTGNACCA